MFALILAGCGRVWHASGSSSTELVELSPEQPTATVRVGVTIDEPGAPREGQILDAPLYLYADVVHYIDTCVAEPCVAELSLDRVDAGADELGHRLEIGAGAMSPWWMALAPPRECRPRRPCAFERTYELSYSGQDLIEIDLVAGFWLRARTRRPLPPDSLGTTLDVLDP